MGSTQFGPVIALDALVLLLFALLVLLDVRDHLVQVGHLLWRCLGGESVRNRRMEFEGIGP